MVVKKLIKWMRRRIYRAWRWFARRFFKRPLTREEAVQAFLKRTEQISRGGGTVKIYSAGVQALQQALYDPDNVVYLLVIKTNRSKDLNLQKWFSNYGKERKW